MTYLSDKQLKEAGELARTMGSDGKSWNEYCAALEQTTGTEYPQAEAGDIDDMYSWFRPQGQQLPLEMMIQNLRKK